MAFDKTKNKLTGGEGEEIAALYLEQKGYKIIDRNVEFPFGEIDILARTRKIIVIVEVKTVRGGGFGEAVDLVRFAKQKKLKLLARAIEQQYPDKTIRIDVVGVDLTCSEPKIEHLESAVEG
ncbi:MAG: YraN family protein [bacterium]|nr:YraN family protein [bacterium]